MTAPAPARPSGPVTVTVARRAAPDQQQLVQAWLQAGTSLAEGFAGFLGAGWLRPEPGSDTWSVLYRFADEEALRAWEASPQRGWWLASAQGLVEEAGSARRTGVEGWFDAPAPAAAPAAPPRWKQAVTIWLGFFPVSLLSALLLLPRLSALPVLPRTVVSTVCITPVMVYLVLPRVTGALQWWLAGRPAPWRRRPAGR